ncbi:MAG: hypothetical protein ACKV2Q_24810 [Planctomycetaceae bacterium]
MTDPHFPRLFVPAPTAKLYEPPLDDDDDVEDFGRSSSFDPHCFDAEINVLTFGWLLCLGAAVTVALWLIADLFVA